MLFGLSYPKGRSLPFCCSKADPCQCVGLTTAFWSRSLCVGCSCHTKQHNSCSWFCGGWSIAPHAFGLRRRSPYLCIGPQTRTADRLLLRAAQHINVLALVMMFLLCAYRVQAVPGYLLCLLQCLLRMLAKWRGNTVGHVLSGRALLVLPAGQAVLTPDRAAGASVELLHVQQGMVAASLVWIGVRQGALRG